MSGRGGQYLLPLSPVGSLPSKVSRHSFLSWNDMAVVFDQNMFLDVPAKQADVDAVIETRNAAAAARR